MLGANAVLELGPGGGNLMGAMHGARTVASELHTLMWEKQPHPGGGRTKVGGGGGTPRSIFANQYASLLGDGSEGEQSDGASSSDGDDEAAETATPSRPPPPKTPAKKLTKAEKALRNARKHRKATRASRGMG